MDGAVENAPGALVVVANSPVPCAPDDRADDPSTTPDEAAAAISWWHAQLASAATREGATLAVFWVGDAVDGQVELTTDGWLGNDPALGGGYLLQVREAAVESRDGLVYANQPTHASLDQASTGTVTSTLAETTAEVEFASGEWAGKVTLERCENAELLPTVSALVVPFVLDDAQVQ